jgi:hypothetical protein
MSIEFFKILKSKAAVPKTEILGQPHLYEKLCALGS